MSVLANASAPSLASPSRLTEVERHAWSDLARAAPLPLRANLGLHLEATPAATLLRCPAIPSPLFNRVFALQANAPPEAVTRLVRRARELAPGPFWVQVDAHARSGRLEAHLEREGLTSHPRDWVRMVRPAGPVPEACTELRIRRASPRDGAAFGAIVAAGFDLSDAGAALIARILDRPGWHPFVALDGDRLAGAAALFVHGAVGYLAFAATSPAFRRRGAQGALMARRLGVAEALGCACVFSETGVSVPGDPQHSHRNMRRFGLREAGRVLNYRSSELTRAEPPS